LFLQALQAPLVDRLDQFVNQCGGRCEADLEAFLAGGQTQPQCNMGFTGSARPKGDNILAVIHELATRQLHGQNLVQRRDGLEVKAVQTFGRRELCSLDPVAFEAVAQEVGFLGFGFYPRSNFMHVDLGPARQWGQRFPVQETAFVVEPPLTREVLAESRTMKGGGAAGVATLGAAGIEAVQQAVADTQSVLQPLIPYLDTLRWVFIAVALVGVSVAIYARWDDWRKGRR